MQHSWLVKAAFGLEGMVKKDLERLGATDIDPSPYGTKFKGDERVGYLANLWLRTADRVMMVMGEFEAHSFEELFQGVNRLPWKKLLPKDARFPVNANCVDSQLMSPSDCQSITKKAMVEALRASYHDQILPETGATFEIDISIRKDVVTVSVNTSGDALSKRGYRTWNGEAPLRETIAAAMALNGGWRSRLPLHDPCCGTGTILVEAAFIATDRAPGLNRPFACDDWALMDNDMIAELRAEAKARHEQGRQRNVQITGTDIDPEALKLCKMHIEQAGMNGFIQVSQKDVRDLQLPDIEGAMLTNPPYGERMGDKKLSKLIGLQLGQLMARAPKWSLGVITPDRQFEQHIGRRADRRRRLYNARLECEYMTFMPKQSIQHKRSKH